MEYLSQLQLDYANWNTSFNPKPNNLSFYAGIQAWMPDGADSLPNANASLQRAQRPGSESSSPPSPPAGWQGNLATGGATNGVTGLDQPLTLDVIVNWSFVWCVGPGAP